MLIFKMDLAWWIDFFIQYVLPVVGFIAAMCLVKLMNLTISDRRDELYERS